MANRIKKGLIFFPEYVDELNELPVRRLIHQHNGNGYLIYKYILKAVFQNGYLMEWHDDSPFMVANNLGVKTISEQTVIEVVRYCCALGLFNKELFTRRSILTSRLIQEEYLDICKRSKRKPMQIMQEFCLIPDEILPDFDHKEEAVFEVYERNFNSEKIKTSEEIANSSEELPKTSEEIGKTSEELQQRKEKKRKVNFNYNFSSFLGIDKKSGLENSELAKKIISGIENTNLRNCVLHWLCHKERVGEPYTKLGTLRGCITRIRSIHEDDLVMVAKVELSIQQGWQGFFPANEKEVRQIREFGIEGFLELKKNGGAGPQKGNKNEKSNKAAANIERAVAAGFALNAVENTKL